MDESDIERRLTAKIKEQRAQIAIAIGYLQAGQPDLAAEVLAAALPEPADPQAVPFACRPGEK